MTEKLLSTIKYLSKVYVAFNMASEKNPYNEQNRKANFAKKGWPYEHYAFPEDVSPPEAYDYIVFSGHIIMAAPANETGCFPCSTSKAAQAADFLGIKSPENWRSFEESYNKSLGVLWALLKELNPKLETLEFDDHAGPEKTNFSLYEVLCKIAGAEPLADIQKMLERTASDQPGSPSGNGPSPSP